MRCYSRLTFAAILFSAIPVRAMTINVTYGTGVPAQAETAFNAIIAAYGATFSNNITVNVTLDWGTTGLGSSSSEITNITYAQWLAQVQADSLANPDNTYLAAGAASLPASNPLPGNGNVTITVADALALGFSLPNINDGTITINGNQPFEYTGTATAGDYDFDNVAEHELDEVLGIGSALTGIANSGLLPSDSGSGTCLASGTFQQQECYEPEDYFRYASNGTRDITTSSSADVYFSYNGTTLVAQFNQDNNAGGNSSADRNDWIYGNAGCPAANYQIQDAVDCPGQAVQFTTASPESVVLQTLGYDLPAAAPEPGTWALLGLGTGVLLWRRKR